MGMENQQPRQHESSEPGYPQRVDEVTESITAVQRSLHEQEDLDATLGRLAETAVRAVPGTDVSSLTIVCGGHSRTAAATDDRVLAIEQQQRSYDSSPAQESTQQRRPVRVGLHDPGVRRWPGFAAAAVEAGIAAYLTAPVFHDEADRPDRQEAEDSSEVVGWLNLYSYSPEGFDPFDEALIRLLTTTVSAALSAERRYQRTSEQVEQLKTALTSRPEIDEAKGVLMAAHGTDADQAFAQLVEQSQQHNVKVITIARQLLTSVQQR